LAFAPQGYPAQPVRCTLIDVETSLKDTPTRRLPALIPAPFLHLVATSVLLIFAPICSRIQAQAQGSTVVLPPPSNGGVFALKDVHRGLKGTAWTIFAGDVPEPMDVEVLGVLRGARGPGQDMILIQLHGAKPEYTGVVAGMSGSPVYIGGKLLGSLSFRIGQFSKEPIAGVTPIEQMLEVRDLPIPPGTLAGEAELSSNATSNRSLGIDPAAPIQPIETPLVMGGFAPEAVSLWQKRLAGTGLDLVMAGGLGGSSSAPPGSAAPAIFPGSAVSAQLVRGDMEIAATCTVTYVDPTQLLACGHPILQAGPVSLAMTATDVVATLASPLNAFKIVNTGATIGAFTEDRAAAVRGVLGAKARMIPVHLLVRSADGDKRFNVEVLDQQSLTAQALLVTIFNGLLQSNGSTEETSYHLTGTIDFQGYQPSPLDVWASAGEGTAAPLQLALQAVDRFSKLYSNSGRKGAVKQINLEVQTVSHRVQVELATARLISGDIVHAGDTVTIEATLQPWQQPARNVRIPVKLPTRLEPGTLRVLVSDAGTLERTLDQPRSFGAVVPMDSVLAQARQLHPADRIYISLLVPETQAGIFGQTVTSLPLSVANTLEPQRAVQEVTLNGESAVVAADAPAGGVLVGLQILNLRIVGGGGLN